MSRQIIRYQEYASSSTGENKCSINSAQLREIQPPRAINPSSEKKSIKKAAYSHIYNDEYLDHFDEAFQHLSSQGRKEESPNMEVKITESTAQINELLLQEKTTSLPSWTDTGSSLVQLGSRSAPLQSRPWTDRGQRWNSGPLNTHGIHFQGSDRPMTCMSVSSNNVEAVVGSCDHSLYVFDVVSGRKKRQLYTKRYGHTEWVTCVNYFQDGRILSAGMDSKICLWKESGVSCQEYLGHSGSISKTLVNDSVKCFISASYDKTLRVWDTEKALEMKCLKGHKAPILDFAWRDQDIVSGSRDSAVILWDILSGVQRRKMTGHTGHITCVAFVESQPHLILSGAQDGHVCVWDNRSPGLIFDLPIHDHGQKGSGALVGIRFSANGSIVTAGADSIINVLDPSASFRTKLTIKDHRDFIYSIECQENLIFSGGGDGMLYVHSVDDGKLCYSLEANKAAVRCVAATATHLLAAGDDGGSVSYDMT